MTVDAEKAVIGAALQSPDIAVDVAATLSAESFTDPLCRAAWSAISGLVDGNDPVDVVTVATRIATTGKGILASPGIPLLEMTRDVVPAHAGYYAEIVAEAWHRRTAVQSGRRLLQRLEQAENVNDALEAHRAELDTIADPAAGAVAAEQVVGRVLDVAENGPGDAVVRTPWSELNRIVKMRPGNLVIVGARPSVGKSVVCSEVAAFNALGRRSSVLFSLEMTTAEVGTRIVSSRSRVPHETISEGKLTDDEWAHVTKVSGDLAEMPLHIDDDPSTSIAKIRGHVRRHKTDLIVVDYLQLMNGPKSESRQNDVAAISKGLKAIAKEADAVVIAASQLNRGVEGRHSKVPTLSDLRESGQIEQDADIVLLLHRDDMYERESARAGEIDVIIAKNRSGSMATVTLGFDGKRARIVQLATEYQRSYLGGSDD